MRESRTDGESEREFPSVMSFKKNHPQCELVTFVRAGKVEHTGRPRQTEKQKSPSFLTDSVSFYAI